MASLVAGKALMQVPADGVHLDFPRGAQVEMRTAQQMKVTAT
jgi:hypothetical protein